MCHSSELTMNSYHRIVHIYDDNANDNINFRDAFWLSSECLLQSSDLGRGKKSVKCQIHTCSVPPGYTIERHLVLHVPAILTSHNYSSLVFML